MPSSPPPDRFQREIDDIIRLAERRLEHRSFGYRVKKSGRRLGNAFGGVSMRLPAAETLGGWGLAFLLVSWLVTLPVVRSAPLAAFLQPWVLALGVVLLTAALVTSLLRGRVASSGGSKVWRGERITYGRSYGGGLLDRLRRLLRGR